MGADASLESTTAPERRASRLSLGFGGLTVVSGLVIVAAVDSLPLVYQYLPLVATVVLFGLPHGAVDHLVLPRARNNPITARSLAFVGLLYLVVGASYAVVWFVAPAAAFALFILVTLFHWGQGDVYALLEFVDADHLETRASRVLALFVRGGLPMLVPLVAFPDQYAFVAETLIGLFDPAGAAALEPVFEPTARALVGVGFGVLVVLSLALGYYRADTLEPWLIDAGETLGLVAFFAVVPPILAIGLYFALWHSIRHILRTLLVDGPAIAALATGNDLAALGRFARDAAPLTAGALVVLGGLALLVPQTPATVPGVAALYLVCIAVLTLPHVVVVSLLDLEQRIWTVD
ncbi:Brp/Blh family beta-carotene 15,15'-dioxygenase [Natronobacterium gregoryi]|uniref:Probable beta-carotene 15,15'-dioxygenase n=2 Tax=Natronobacterium gregoryi TaxID=44930 RepID=L0ACB4_NATGS|nr:Brp/Blh family beta-carotene 15,15'-dioxygenase [Natronobacterium gregoryi]AFZ71506.1 beta-carotene 15,15''-monooxygenase, Brp/Blh family [Natronobacterium gregoryi SP2]ELY66721.1 beta-carotene 15,15'-monooxygenase [Natronobacterium gregoryi SP2]PLK21280.1 beta-carotene 15,15'-monooxygenase [Natronobacterium gregoryi SP2]SFI83162.1 beta-carotene 15,15'-monooxygenase, Brp/Blh family [Natronobacterium gregoryi]